MSINKQLIRDAVRKRVIAASKIDPITQFQEENKDFSPEGVDLWIAEYCIGGAEIAITPRRSRISSFIIQYDLFAPLNSGTEYIDSVMAAICDEFDMADPVKSTLDIPGYSINLNSITPEVDAGKNQQRQMLVFSFDVIKG
jgi:hypothetical protein